MATGFNVSGLAARLAASLALVFATYNPEGKSYYHWVLAPLFSDTPSSGSAPLKLLVGMALVAVWVVFINATRRSIGVGGALLVTAVVGALIWLLLDTGMASANSSRGVSYIVLIGAAVILTVGMSWSHISRRLSGQVDMDPS
jgi:hypothetical protein